MKTLLKNFGKELISVLFLAFIYTQSANSQIFINENFSSASGTTPPNGWVLQDEMGNGEVWSFDDINGRDPDLPIAFPAAIFESKFGIPDYSERSILESPEFDASCCSDIILKYDFIVQNNAQGKILIEAYNGSVWILVVEQSEIEVSTTQTVSNIDLSSVIGGVANAKVRFTWSGFDFGYWIIDNVKIFEKNSIVVATDSITDITSNSALGSGKIEPSTNISSVGFCWNTSPNPEVTHFLSFSMLEDDNTFTADITGLTPGTEYFVRAYAIDNDNNIYYDNQISFTTNSENSETTVNCGFSKIFCYPLICDGVTNYNNNESYIETYISSNASYQLQVVFNRFDLALGDNFYVYDGANIQSRIIGIYDKSNLPDKIISTGKSLTFKFESDNVLVAKGINASISCVSPAISTCFISGNQVWSGIKDVNCMVEIQAGANLTIMPGTTVNFLNESAIIVKGSLQAIGNKDDFVKFTSDNIGWAGIQFDNSSGSITKSNLEYCKIENVKATGHLVNAVYIKDFFDLTIRNCIFNNNISSKEGGAIYIENSFPKISENIFANNTSNTHGGAIYITDCQQPGITLNNNIIVNNEAYEFGGGIVTNNSVVAINNCVIANNMSYYGGGLGFDGKRSISVTNTIIWNNSATIGTQVYMQAMSRLPDNQPKFMYCDIEGGKDWFVSNSEDYIFDYDNNNNINIYPNFTKPSQEIGISGDGLLSDWSLLPNSSSVNLGDPDTDLLGITIDYNGNPRIRNGKADIGAYELQQASEFCGKIFGNTILEGDLVKVTCDLIVEEYATLTIKPGTKLEFQNNAGLIVNGRLIAEGKEGMEITFTSTSPFSTWRGINFDNISLENDSSVLDFCIIENAYARECNLFSDQSATIEIECEGNGNGGGISVINFSKLSISNSTIQNNVADKQGGGIYLQKSDPIIINNNIKNNKAKVGGGIFLGSKSRIELKNNSIIYNIATISGGGIAWGNYSEATILNNIISNNTAIKSGGAVSEGEFGVTRFINNEICNNSAFQGGGILMNNSDWTLLNNTICNNSASKGGGILADDASIDIINSIIYGNTDQIYLQSSSATGTNDKHLNFKYCNIQNGVAGIKNSDNLTFSSINYESSNIKIQPDFIRPATSTGVIDESIQKIVNWSLKSTSPCKNYGFIDCSFIDLPYNDIAKNTRVINNIDLGAYEFQELETIKYVWGGDISKHTIWDFDSVKVVCNDMFVNDGVILEIVAGTVVSFMEHSTLNINGTLLAKGTKDKPITFTSFDISGYSDFTHLGWGGIRFDNTRVENAPSIISYCKIKFVRNDYDEGALFFNNCSNVEINNCIISDNYAQTGAAMYLHTSSPKIFGNTFSYNSSDDGTIYISESEVTFYNNIICNNYINYDGGGFNIQESNPQLYNNIIVNNSCDGDGGAIYVRNSNVAIANSVIVNNNAFGGGAIYSNNTYVEIENSIIWGNKQFDEDNFAQIDFGMDTPFADFKYCNIENGNLALSSDESIDVENVDNFNLLSDPLFQSPSQGAGYLYNGQNADWSLKDLSQNINAGNPQTNSYEYSLDMVGNPRIYENSFIDIGAYESTFEFAPVDIEALQEFYNSTDGNNWTVPTNKKWFDGNIKNWYGIKAKGGRVREIEIIGKNIAGEIPKAIENIHFLEKLELYDNEIVAISPELNNLPNLQVLNLRNNKLSGEIPASIGDFSELVTLNLSNNSFKGSVSQELGKLSNLLIMDLSNNNLVDFPDLSGTDSNLESLEFLSLNYNDFVFNDIEPNIDVSTGISYSPQSYINETETISVLEGTKGVLSVNILGDNLEYQWIKDGENIDKKTNPLIITNASYADDGTYECIITNSNVPDLILERNKITVEIITNNQLDKEALIALYEATGGDNWTNNKNWNTDEPIKEWEGVVVEYKVLRIDLSGNNLSGELPVELKNLVGLEALDLSDNNLYGVIPNIGQMKELKELYLQNNKLTGIIPASLTNINTLSIVNLSNNQLTAKVPEFTSEQLRILDFSNNMLVDLPTFSSSSLNSLQLLSVGDNELTFEDLEANMDVAPTFVYNPQKNIGEEKVLEITGGETYTLIVDIKGKNNKYQWYLNDEEKTNDANSSVLSITNANTNDIGKYYCKITNEEVPGLTIESEIINVIVEISTEKDSLALVDLYNKTNGLSWHNNYGWLTLPLEQWKGIKLENSRVSEIDLADNNLTGTLPTNIDLPTELVTLDLSGNNILGLFPKTIGNLEKLEEVFLYENNFSGTLPANISKLKFLRVLSISKNSFTGKVPDLQNPELSIIDLSDNKFVDLSGFESSSLSNLQLLSVSKNKFTFNDLISNIDIAPTYIYSPQASVDKLASYELLEGDFLVLTVNVTGNNNNYQWIKDGKELLFDGTESSYTINSARPFDTGTYICNITNDELPELTLVREPINVNIKINMEADKNALIALYKATNGANWINSTNWFTEDINDWYGVEVNENSKKVVSIDLAGNNLSGELPPNLIDLTELMYLNLSDNKLYGKIPQAIGNIKLIEELYLQNNKLSGNIPENLANLENLTVLNFSNNLLTSSVPNFVTDHLHILDFSNNILVDLPTFDALKLNALQLLSVGDNALTFEDLEINIDVASTFIYNPQLDIGYKTTRDITEGHSSILTVDTQGENNKYQWYHDDDLIKDNGASSTFSITNASANDAGEYYCKITNDLVQGLIIESAPINVSVNISLELDIEALTALYNSTNGDNWLDATNWFDFDKPLSEWYGVEVGDNGKVSEIDLSDNKLTGIIPSEMKNLSELIYLNLSGNSISGEISEEIGDLSKLEQLLLYNNSFSGSLPSSLADLNNLEIINVSYNDLVGTVPDFKNKKLSIIDIKNNKFVDLPSFDKSLIKNLQLLSVSNNKFTFEDLETNTDIAATYIYSPQASVIIDNETQFEEGTPLTITLIVNGIDNDYQWIKDGNNILYDKKLNTYHVAKAESMDAGEYVCQITNTELPELTLVTNPLNIKIITNDSEDRNALIALYNATNGANWIVNDNWTTNSSLADWFGVTVTNGRVSVIDLQKNNLTGILPNEIGNLNFLSHLNLSENDLGEIPDSIIKLSKLQILNLSSDSLFGEIPKGLDALKGLTELFMYDNKLEGSIPDELSQLDNIKIINLGHNKLEGAIPRFSSQSINLLDFSNNELDELPVYDKNKLSKLQAFSVSNNMLDFGDLLPNIGIAPTFAYAPQANINEELDSSSSVGEKLTYNTTLDGIGNKYQWYKDGEDLLGETNDSYSIDDANIIDAGVYICVVTNENVPSLELQRNTITQRIEIELTIPKVRKPIDYCVGTNSIIFSVDGISTYTHWYSDADLSENNLIGKGENVSWNVYGDRDTIYVVNKAESAYVVNSSGSYETVAVDIPIEVRPSITKNGSVLIATYNEKATYKWYKDGLLLSATANRLTLTGDGTYKVQITVGMCSATSREAIIIGDDMQVVDIDMILSDYSNLQLFPNPVNDILNLQFENEYKGELFVVISDIAGRKLNVNKLEKLASLIKYKIDISTLNKGMYIITIQSENGEITRKIIKN